MHFAFADLTFLNRKYMCLFKNRLKYSASKKVFFSPQAQMFLWMLFPLVISGSMHILCIVFFNTCKNKASESVSGLSDLDSGLKLQWKQTSTALNTLSNTFLKEMILFLVVQNSSSSFIWSCFSGRFWISGQMFNFNHQDFSV